VESVGCSSLPMPLTDATILTKFVLRPSRRCDVQRGTSESDARTQTRTKDKAGLCEEIWGFTIDATLSKKTKKKLPHDEAVCRG